MSMIDEDAERNAAIQRERELLAGRTGEPKSRVFNVLSELFGEKGRLSQVDEQQAITNARRVEQDAIAADDRAIELKQDADTLRDQHVLRTAQFLQKAQERGVLDDEMFARAGQSLDAIGIPVEQYGPIMQQAAEDPDVLPSFIAALTKQSTAKQSRVKAVGKPMVLTVDGKQHTRQFFDDGHFEDVALEGARLVSDVQKDIRLATGERRVDVAEKKVDPEVRGAIKLAEKAEEGTVARVNEALPEARSSQVAVSNANRILELADEGIRTGSFAGFRQETKRFFADILGMDDKDIANTDEAFNRAGLAVAEQIKAFGAGTGLSDADREFAAGIVGGKSELDITAIKNLMQMQKLVNTKRIMDYNRDRNALTGDNKRLQKLFPRIPVSSSDVADVRKNLEAEEAVRGGEDDFDARVQAILEGAE